VWTEFTTAKLNCNCNSHVEGVFALAGLDRPLWRARQRLAFAQGVLLTHRRTAIKTAPANSALTYDLLQSVCLQWVSLPSTAVAERGAQQETTAFQRSHVLPIRSLFPLGALLVAVLASLLLVREG
jgi:hypothetical protein